MATDWRWCYENPNAAAFDIDRLEQEKAELKVALKTALEYTALYVRLWADKNNTPGADPVKVPRGAVEFIAKWQQRVES